MPHILKLPPVIFAGILIKQGVTKCGCARSGRIFCTSTQAALSAGHLTLEYNLALILEQETSCLILLLVRALDGQTAFGGQDSQPRKKWQLCSWYVLSCYLRKPKVLGPGGFRNHLIGNSLVQFIITVEERPHRPRETLLRVSSDLAESPVT